MKKAPFRFTSRSLSLPLVGVTASLLALPYSAKAATVTWDGGGTDNNWTTGANWTNVTVDIPDNTAPSDPAVPTANDTAPPAGVPDIVQFGGSTRTNPVLGVDDWFVDRLVFLSGAGSFVLGDALNKKTIALRPTQATGHDSNHFIINDKTSGLVTINDNLAVYGGPTSNNVGSGIITKGDLTINGNISAPFSVSSMRFKPSDGRTLTLNGVMSGAWSQVASNAPGTTILNAVNTYTGTTAVWNGTLVAGVDALATANDVPVNGAFGSSSGGAISMGNTANGAAYTAAIMTGGAVTIGRDITMVSNPANTNTYTVGGNTAHNSFYTGDIAMSTLHFLTVTAAAGGKVNIDRITQTSSVTTQLDDVFKTGTGIVALTGTSNYSGDTTVRAGTFLVNGTLSATSTATGGLVGDVFVNANVVSTTAGLGGSGTINRDVVLQAGAGTSILTPGDMSIAGVSSAGTLTIGGDLTFANSANILNFDLGTTSDKVVVAGNLTLTGTLNILDSGGFGVGNYELFYYSGALTYTPGALTIGTTPNNGLTYAIDTTSSGSSVFLVVTPEPGRAVLLMLGVASLLMRRKRSACV